MSNHMQMYNSEPLISAVKLHKNYAMGNGELEVLKKVDVKIYQGEAVCIVGPSGAGKSTLLHILGTLDRPSSGQVLFEGRDLSQNSDDELARFRAESLGFVFQFHHLLAEFTALENVAIACRLVGQSRKESQAKSEALLKDAMGLGDRLNHFPSELSGGEQQRVAIARALVRKPRVLFADEPTGNLDSQNGQKIQDLFFQLKRELGLTLVVVTHDQRFAARFPRRLVMQDGAI